MPRGTRGIMRIPALPGDRAGRLKGPMPPPSHSSPTGEFTPLQPPQDAARRRSLRTLLCLGLGMWAGSSRSQDYPSRPLRLIVPSSPGGIVDVEARRLAARLAEALKQPVVVDNRPGANNTIGMDLLAKSTPDGYTIGYGSTSALAAAPALMPALPYDPARDFAPIIQTLRVATVLVIPSALPARTTDEFASFVRKQPGKLAYGSNGPGGMAHVMGEQLCRTLGLDMLHVPYKAQANMLMSVLANETQMGFDFPVTAAPHVKAGRLRALMVTSRKRVPLLPDVPTVHELRLPQLENYGTGGLLAPAGTPKEIVRRLHLELTRIVREPAVVASYQETGAEFAAGTPEDFRQHIVDELKRWKALVARLGIS